MLLLHITLFQQFSDFMSPMNWPWPIFIWMLVGIIVGAIAGSLCHEDISWLGYLAFPGIASFLSIVGIIWIYSKYAEENLVKLMLTGFFSVFFFIAFFLAFFFLFHYRKYLKV